MTELVAHVRKGKELGRFIKAHLEPTWPTVPTLDLPPRDLADQLIERYILTSESVHRIVHIPTLRREFESAWSSTTKLDLSQVIMLKLVMAIGAATHDAQFTLRGLATLWVYEAIAWLSRPEYKSRLYIRHIQMAMLLILARQTVGVGSSVTWMSMGELLRTAIFAGLHRDPSRLPRQTFFASELRRRLWNTLLEMELQSSLETGAMPSFAMHHFDTRPPGNYDDEQLDENEPEAKSEEIYTNMSIARALRKTYAVRLAIAKSLNEIGPPATYKDTLLLDTKLRAAYKHVSQYLPQWKPSDFQARYMDGIIRRSLMALHMPFFGPSLTEIAYAYTRKVVVDNALTLWRAFFTPSSQYVSRTPNRSGDTNVEPSDFSMLMAYRPGTFRGVVIQTINILLADARAQAQENDTLGVTESSSDCREVLEEAKDWSLQCIRMGEVNIKGYLFIAMIGGQIQAIKRGAGHDESQAAFIQSVAEAANYCVSILEERVAALVSKDQREADVDALNAQQLFQPVDDWGTSVSFHLLPFSQLCPANRTRRLTLSLTLVL